MHGTKIVAAASPDSTSARQQIALKALSVLQKEIPAVANAILTGLHQMVFAVQINSGLSRTGDASTDQPLAALPNSGAPRESDV